MKPSDGVRINPFAVAAECHKPLPREGAGNLRFPNCAAYFFVNGRHCATSADKNEVGYFHDSGLRFFCA